MSNVRDITPTPQTPLYITLDSPGASSSSLLRQATLKSRLARLPVLEAPRRRVILQDLGPRGQCQTPEVHLPSSVFAAAPSQDSSPANAPSSSPPTNPRRPSMSQSTSSARPGGAVDSYFQLPVGNHTPRVSAVHQTICGVRLEATKDAALQPPSPLLLPPSSSSGTTTAVAVGR